MTGGSTRPRRCGWCGRRAQRVARMEARSAEIRGETVRITLRSIRAMDLSSLTELDPGAVDERLPLLVFRIHEPREGRGVAADRLDASAADATLHLVDLAHLHQRVAQPLADIGREPGRA